MAFFRTPVGTQWLVMIALLAPTASIGCFGSSENDMIVDPLHLVENYVPTNPRHHPVKLVEVELGDYYVTIPLEKSFDVLSIRFQAYAVVPRESANEISNEIEKRRTRMRDRVLEIVQKIDIKNLTDPSMAWLKGELVPLLNRELRTDGVRDVVFADFSLERG